MLRFRDFIFARRYVLLLLAGVLMFICLLLWRTGRPQELLDPARPVVLTLWHNFRGQLKHAAGRMVDDFNRTEGKKRGIILSVLSIAESAVLNENLEAIAGDAPGAPAAPDLVMTGPKVALLLAQKKLLVDAGAWFNEKELEAYVPRFLQEGRIADGKLYVFPIAKSTEMLFVNRTFFDRFAAGTGVSMDQFATMEGLLSLAQKYYEWTDAETPDIPDDGKAFFMCDSPFNLAEIVFAQLGGEFCANDTLNYSSPLFKKVWDISYDPMLKGYSPIYEAYSTDLMKTGEIICYIGSSAGIAFCPSAVTHADNSSEPIEFSILPYPVIKGGKKMAIQRGNGFCVFKSTPEKEYAAGVFLKWLTEPERNLLFLESTGYLPVTQKALSRNLIDLKTATPLFRGFLEVAAIMQNEYDFLIPSVPATGEALKKQYESRLRKSAWSSKEKYRTLRNSRGADEALHQISENALRQFIGQ